MSAAETQIIDGRYRVVELLGEGSSARTLLVEQVETTKRFALKELRTEHLESWKHYELFEREAKTLAGLRHHGIPEVSDFFEVDEQGRLRLCLVQELIQGQDLSECIASKRSFSVEEMDQLVLGLLDILDYLHTSTPSIFHRDIKPSNIMVRPSGRPVLIDFGGVCHGWRIPGQGGSTIIGTHGYTPPEQYMGQVSAASDLYALGASLLHVVGARPPTDYDFSMGRIDVPDRLPCSPQLRHLIARCLEPAARDRPQSAREARTLYLDFGRARGGDPGDQAPPEGPGLVTPLSFSGLDIIEPGPAPRAVDDANRGLYKALIPGLASGFWGWTLFLLLTIVSMGILPLIFLAIKAQRKHEFGDLFRKGIATKGKILSVSPTGQQPLNKVMYEYEVEGHRYRGMTSFYDPDVQVLAPGDPVLVLYKKGEPGISCMTYDSKSSTFFTLNSSPRKMLTSGRKSSAPLFETRPSTLPNTKEANAKEKAPAEEAAVVKHEA